MENKPYIIVQSYDDRGDPCPPNNYRPELVMEGIILLPDIRKYPAGCMPKEKANSLAEKIASSLGIEAKLAE